MLDSEFDEATRRIAGLFPQFMEAMQAALNEQLAVLAQDIREGIPDMFPATSDHAHERTGNLMASVQAGQAITSGSRIEGYVDSGGETAKYAKYFVPTSIGGTGGTGPHAIAARNAEFLHFWQGGIEKFRKTVQHPGFGEHDFITPLFEQWIETLPPYIQEAVDRIAF